jgi:hypothetical protein
MNFNRKFSPEPYCSLASDEIALQKMNALFYKKSIDCSVSKVNNEELSI